MKTIEAVYNAGRWLVHCPVHGKDGAVLAMDYHAIDATQSRHWTADGQYICPVCYPGIVAQLQVVKRGRIEKIYDKSAQATARLIARARDEIYTVTFPDIREQIEATLKDRPRLMKNWDGRHETLQFLEDENKIVTEIVRGKHGI